MRIRFGKYRWQPGLLPSLATIALLPLFLALGFWQLDRGEQKNAAAQLRESRGQLEPLHRPEEDLATLLHRRLRLTGRYVSGRQFLVDNMVHAGQPGYHVLTPFLASQGGPWLLVNRGWVPLGATREDRPGIEVPQDETIVTGIVAVLPRPGLRLGGQNNNNDDWPAVVSFPTTEQIKERLGRQIFPYQLKLDAKEPNGFVREWQMDDTASARHRGYALQWFSFAAILLGLFFFLNVRTEGDHE